MDLQPSIKKIIFLLVSSIAFGSSNKGLLCRNSYSLDTPAITKRFKSTDVNTDTTRFHPWACL